MTIQPSVARGRHHVADGGPPAVGAVEQRDVRELAGCRRQLGHRPCATRDHRRRQEVGDVLERPVQLGGRLPVLQGHVGRRTSGIAAENHGDDCNGSARHLDAQPDFTPTFVRGVAGSVIGVPAYSARIESMRWRARIASDDLPWPLSTCSRPFVTSTPRSAPFHR